MNIGFGRRLPGQAPRCPRGTLQDQCLTVRWFVTNSPGSGFGKALGLLYDHAAVPVDATTTASESRPAGTRALHRWSVATLVAMFPLIWFGGLTTSHGAGLAVPDWPNTYGYNMFAVPWNIWMGESAGGIFFEHTHRLLGSVTGLFALAMTLWAWLAPRREPRIWVRWTATALLGAIIVQGVLGGLRVTEVSLGLAIAHGIFAQLTLCLAGFVVLVTSPWWARLEQQATLSPLPAADGRRLFIASAALTVLIFAQLVAGAFMRHYQAGLAVPDFPLSYGQLLPPMSPEGMGRINDARAFDLSLPPTTLGQVWLHTAHRLGAVLVTLAVVGLVRRASRIESAQRPTRHVALLISLLVIQIGLGVATIWMRKPADIATAHVAIGALLLLVSWVLTVKLARQHGWRQPIAASDVRHLREQATLRAPRQSAAQAEVGVPVSV